MRKNISARHEKKGPGAGGEDIEGQAMSYTEWNIPYDRTSAPQSLLDAGFSPLLAAVLARRGMTDGEQARSFIDCDDSLLGDPLMMTDMPLAVRRLTRAIETREHVAVYGDYDVDGITSSCLLAGYLRSKGLETELYIPDRIEEGYGVNTGAVRQLAERGVTLIVTVDCGVTAIEETRFAASLGVDMIITDHHECRDELPDALAVVDPKRPDCCYPTHDLAGVGVAFKLLCAMEGDVQAVLDKYADLVAVGTVADVMPLIGENRYIIKAGLRKLSLSPRPGLRALMEEAGLNARRVSATAIGFTLAPRLNAAGRLGRTQLAADLLLTESPAEAARLAAELCQLNRDRQSLETEIWNQAVAMLGEEKPARPIVLAAEGWHQGVIGIAASRLTEAYHVPAIMICLDGEKGKGSCRSYGGFNLFEALSACSDCLEGFGGHALAAGLTIKPENVDAFRERIGKYYDEHPSSHVSVLDIDVRVDSPELLDMRSVADLERLEPCGSGHPSAQLCMTGAVLETATPIGGGRHLKLRLSKFGHIYEAVFFSKTMAELGVKPGAYVDAAFIPQINEFRARKTVQLLMTDIREHDMAPAQELLGGAELVPEALREAVPVRRDFVRLWKAILGFGGRFEAPLRDVFERLAPEMYDLRLCLCLRIFQELQLIDTQCDGTRLRLVCRPGAKKVNLGDSAILKTLSSRA